MSEMWDEQTRKKIMTTWHGSHADYIYGLEKEIVRLKAQIEGYENALRTMREDFEKASEKEWRERVRLKSVLGDAIWIIEEFNRRISVKNSLYKRSLEFLSQHDKEK